MSLEISIRSERPEDGPAISDIVRRAYATVAYSDHREHLMIERLRKSEAYNPALSLLAEIGNEMVGHILLTTAEIRGSRSSVVTLALAPLSVVPEHQFCGVGKRLVGEVHRRAADLGFGSVLLVGIPSYYPQFGYEPLSHYPIKLPFEAPAENCMILPLMPHALDSVSGLVHYTEGWLEH